MPNEVLVWGLGSHDLITYGYGSSGTGPVSVTNTILVFGLGGHDLITYGYGPSGTGPVSWGLIGSTGSYHETGLGATLVKVVSSVSWAMAGSIGSYHETGLGATFVKVVQGPAPTAPTGADPGVESGINIEGVNSMTVHVAIGMEIL